MIKVIVSEQPTQTTSNTVNNGLAIALGIHTTSFITFDFENFNYQTCQDLIEICLKNDKIIKIFNAEE